LITKGENCAVAYMQDLATIETGNQCAEVTVRNIS
jgi:hypothetical protein